MEHLDPGTPRLPVVLLVDTSAAMEGELMPELNRSVDAFVDTLRLDGRLWDCTDLCVIRYDSKAVLEIPFAPVGGLRPPVMRASELYDCTMNAGIITALDVIRHRKRQYRESGVEFWRPLLFLLTAFLPTDREYTGDACRRLQESIAENKIRCLHHHCGAPELAERLHGYGTDGAQTVGPLTEGFRLLKAAMEDSLKESLCDTLTQVQPVDTPFEIRIEL